VGYVKKNFLHGLELTDFSTIHAAAQVWLHTIANVRIHGETQQRAQARIRTGRSVVKSAVLPGHISEQTGAAFVRASAGAFAGWDLRLESTA
jgi:hypothetical protein